jgi:hypothetical protein
LFSFVRATTFIGFIPTFGGLIPSFLCVTYPFQLVQGMQLLGHPSFFGQVTIFTSETKPHLNSPKWLAHRHAEVLGAAKAPQDSGVAKATTKGAPGPRRFDFFWCCLVMGNSPSES